MSWDLSQQSSFKKMPFGYFRISSFQIHLGFCQVSKPAQQFCGSFNFCFSPSFTWIVLNIFIYSSSVKVEFTVPLMTLKLITELSFILGYIRLFSLKLFPQLFPLPSVFVTCLPAETNTWQKQVNGMKGPCSLQYTTPGRHGHKRKRQLVPWCPQLESRGPLVSMLPQPDFSLSFSPWMLLLTLGWVFLPQLT